MKVLFLIVFLIFSNLSFSQQSSAELFSSNQNEQIVKAIDFICGDLWCEGEYNFKFNNISCSKFGHDCNLNFQFIESLADNSVIYSPEQKCHLEGIYNINQVMADDEFLQPVFIDKLNECIESLSSAYLSERK